MTQSRDQQVSLEDTPFYHCYVRCVRRAYLCGEDAITGVSYAHRKQWITSRIRFLSYVYAIDVCAYAVMDNHYHIVLLWIKPALNRGLKRKWLSVGCSCISKW